MKLRTFEDEPIIGEVTVEPTISERRYKYDTYSVAVHIDRI